MIGRQLEVLVFFQCDLSLHLFEERCLGAQRSSIELAALAEQKSVRVRIVVDGGQVAKAVYDSLADR